MHSESNKFNCVFDMRLGHVLLSDRRPWDPRDYEVWADEGPPMVCGSDRNIISLIAAGNKLYVFGPHHDDGDIFLVDINFLFHDPITHLLHAPVL